MLPFQVTAQLNAGDGSCWEAALDPALSRNGSGLFLGRMSAP